MSEGNKFDIDWIVSCLKENVCEVKFIKKNGDERVMKCTLHPKYLPITETVTEETKSKNGESISVWDTEVNGWRSFRLDSVKEFSFQLN